MCVCVCVCLCVHMLYASMYMHACMHAFTCMHMHACTCTASTRARAHAHTHCQDLEIRRHVCHLIQTLLRVRSHEQVHPLPPPPPPLSVLSTRGGMDTGNSVADAFNVRGKRDARCLLHHLVRQHARQAGARHEDMRTCLARNILYSAHTSCTLLTSSMMLHAPTPPPSTPQQQSGLYTRHPKL